MQSANSRARGARISFLSRFPPWSLGIEINSPEDYRKVFDRILKIARRAEEAEKVKVFVVLGVHPAELTKYYGRLGLSRSVEIMRGGLEIASEYVAQGKAIGLKSGRPHYEVEPKIWNRIQ